MLRARSNRTLTAELKAAQDRFYEQRHALELILAGQETERREVAHELHEQTAQALSAIELGLGGLERELDAAPLRSRAQSLRSQVADTLGTLRELAVGLRPPALDQLGLVPALRGLTERASARSGRPIVFEVDGLSDRLPAHLETTVYRVVDDIIVVLCGPSRIRISLGAREGTITITGTPFGPAGVLATSDEVARMGARLALVDGTIAFRGEGTQMLVAEIPVPV